MPAIPAFRRQTRSAWSVSSKPAAREYMVITERAIGMQVVDKNTPAPRNSEENISKARQS